MSISQSAIRGLVRNLILHQYGDINHTFLFKVSDEKKVDNTKYKRKSESLLTNGFWDRKVIFNLKLVEFPGTGPFRPYPYW